MMKKLILITFLILFSITANAQMFIESDTTINMQWYKMEIYDFQGWKFSGGAYYYGEPNHIDTVYYFNFPEIINYIQSLESRIIELEKKLLPSFNLGEPNKYWEERGIHIDRRNYIIYDTIYYKGDTK